MSERGELDQIRSEHPGIYFRDFHKIQQHMARAIQVETLTWSRDRKLETCPNLFIFGEPRSGKSTQVGKLMKDVPCYIKDHNKWWCSYKQQPVVVIEDITSGWGINKLKNWADTLPFRAEFKGGSFLIRPEAIVITSNFCWCKLAEGMNVSALRDRFTNVYAAGGYHHEDILFGEAYCAACADEAIHFRSDPACANI